MVVSWHPQKGKPIAAVHAIALGGRSPFFATGFPDWKMKMPESMRSLGGDVVNSAKSALRHFCHVSGISAWKNRGIDKPFIIMYHGVDGMVDRALDLESQLLYLRKHFDIVSLDRLAAQTAPTSGKVPVAITFDDGLKNNFTNVVPLLVRHRVPATFFVCPALIDDGTWLWNHESRARLAMFSAGELRSFCMECGIAGATVEDAVDWMKNQPVGRRKVVEERIRAKSPSFSPTPVQHALYDIMSWDDVASLPDLVTVGSHTNSHAILTTLDRDELIAEIVGSKRQLETRLGRPIDCFCYPNGSINAEVVEEVRKHYKAAVTVEAGYVDFRDDRYLLKRIAASPRLGLSSFAWQLHRLGR